MNFLTLMLPPDVGDKLNNLIDPWMVNALERLQTIADQFTGIYVDDARTLCAIMMLFYLSMQAYTLMTGDGKVSLIPLLRPFLFFIIVVNFSGFVNLLTFPLNQLDLQAKQAMYDTRRDVNERFDIREQQKELLIKYVFQEVELVDESLSQIEKFLQDAAEFGNAVANPLDTLSEKLAYGASLLQLKLQTSLFHFFEVIIFMMFKGVVYFLYFIRVFMLSVLKLIGPIIFALSVTGVYRDLWVQWISKFVSVSLYGAFAHFAIVLAYAVMIFGIDLDISSTGQLIAEYEANPTTGATILLKSFIEGQNGGTALLVAAIVGIFGLLMVPLLSTWVLGANSTTQVGSKAVNAPANAAAAIAKKAIS